MNLIKSLIQDQYKSSLYKLTHKLGYTQVDLKVHGEIITCLEDEETRKKIICVPRGAFKSTICSVSYPIWRLLRNPNETILIDTEIYSNSITYLREIKQHLESSNMINTFGEFKGSIWNEDQIVIKQRTQIRKEASITAGAVGTTKVGQHYDTICSDDYNSPRNTNNPERARKVIEHFKYNLNILNPGGLYVIVGTRYSEDDLIGYLLRDILEQKNLSEGIF